MPLARSRRMYCQPCLDWSERRYHLKGAVGAGLLCRCLELGWFKRERDTRALRLTPTGTLGLLDVFGVALGGAVPAPAGAGHLLRA
jgi:hypothetical protein